MDRPISMIYAVHPTVMKSTPGAYVKMAKRRKSSFSRKIFSDRKIFIQKTKILLVFLKNFPYSPS